MLALELNAKHLLLNVTPETHTEFWSCSEIPILILKYRELKRWVRVNTYVLITNKMKKSKILVYLLP